MPAQLQQPDHGICFFAQTNFRGQRRKFGIKTDDRRRHMYLIGKTGMGKSTTIENMIIQDIREGRGVGVVDPHGDLAEKILDFIPPHRINDVVYFNPADINYPIAFNILENVDSQYKHLIASGLMGVFTKIWENVWSARMEYIMNNCILALLDSPGNTLLGINRLLVDKDYRKKIVMRITDPVVRSFWVNEYANYNDRFRTEAIAPIQNKVGQFLSTAIVRNIVGQSKSTIDMREIMDSGKILIMNLSKGRIGEDNSALLGAMMITKLQLAAMSRVDVPEPERKDFFLYVDEFQNFATDAFADILSEARKYRLSLILAHQYIEQLEENVAAAIFGNVGTIVCFRVGATDAEELVKEFSPYFTEEDLVNLTKFDIYLRLMIDGVASKPFSATSMAPLSTQEISGNREKVIGVSRERYARNREEVEEKIIRWTDLEDVEREDGGTSEGILDVPEEEQRYSDAGLQRKIKTETAALPHSVPPPEISPIPKQPPTPLTVPAVDTAQKSEPKQATCDNCGRGTLIMFEPDANRNVFCKSCLKKFKKGLIDPSILVKRNVRETYDELPSLIPEKKQQTPSPEPVPLPMAPLAFSESKGLQRNDRENQSDAPLPRVGVEGVSPTRAPTPPNNPPPSLSPLPYHETVPSVPSAGFSPPNFLERMQQGVDNNHRIDDRIPEKPLPPSAPLQPKPNKPDRVSDIPSKPAREMYPKGGADALTQQSMRSKPAKPYPGKQQAARPSQIPPSPRVAIPATAAVPPPISLDQAIRMTPIHFRQNTRPSNLPANSPSLSPLPTQSSDRQDSTILKKIEPSQASEGKKQENGFPPAPPRPIRGLRPGAVINFNAPSAPRNTRDIIPP